jgi:hypothetical protein
MLFVCYLLVLLQSSQHCYTNCSLRACRRYYSSGKDMQYSMTFSTEGHCCAIPIDGKLLKTYPSELVPMSSGCSAASNSCLSITRTSSQLVLVPVVLQLLPAPNCGILLSRPWIFAFQALLHHRRLLLVVVVVLLLHYRTLSSLLSLALCAVLIFSCTIVSCKLLPIAAIRSAQFS